MKNIEPSKVTTRQNSQKSAIKVTPTITNSVSSYENKQQQQQNIKMGEQDVTEIKNLLASMKKSLDSTNKEVKAIKSSISSIESEFKMIKDNIESLKNDITNVKTDMETTNKRVELLERAKLEDDNVKITMQSEINALQQLSLSNQMSIHNLPLDCDRQQAIDALYRWSNIDINMTSFKRISMAKNESSRSSTLYLEFQEAYKRVQLMNFVRKRQKPDKKYIPILAENIFELTEGNTSRGIEVHFRDVLTDANKKIFNMARKNKNCFKSVWLGNQGYVMVKYEFNMKPIKVLSEQHLNLLIKTKPSNNVQK